MATFSFRPRPRPTLLTALLVPCFIALGFWQLDRAHLRETAENLLETRAAQPAMPLPTILVPAASLRDRHVAATGSYEPGRLFFLDNQVRQGRVGYDVVTPLHLAGSDLRVLVDRGWVPAPPDRRQLPSVATPTGSVQVDGVAVVPSTWTFSLAKPGGRWEDVWQRVDLDRFQTLTHEPLQPVVVRLSPASAAGGFARQWPRADAGAARNRSYAVQWFAFALVALGFWIRSASRKRP